MNDIQRLQNLRQGIGRLSRGQKLLVGVLLLIVAITWLAVCVLVISFFV